MLIIAPIAMATLLLMTTQKKRRPTRLLDLYCCAGGAAMGYHLGGFDEIIGVDHIRKRNYPFKQIKADVPTFLKEKPMEWFRQFDLIHASPPCRKFSRTRHLVKAQGNKVRDVDHIALIQKFLKKTGVPYVIENVTESPLTGTTICGSSFGLKVRRHRIFESTFPIDELPCRHKEQGRPVGVYGSMGDQVKGIDKKHPERGVIFGGRTADTIEEAREAMGIDWMGWNNIREAVPPAYTQHIAECFWRSQSNRSCQ
jgi:DNA (cytosine-5)-methyltransferase 1